MTSTTNGTVKLPNERKALRALAALVVLVAIVVGVPLALAAWGHWPISGMPSLDEIQDSWTSAVSDTAVFGLLTLTAWVMWALFLLSVVVEAQAEIAQRRAGRVPLAGPVQRSARYLVVSLLLWISSLSASSGKGGESLPDAFAVESVAPGEVGVSVRGDPDTLISSSPSVTVPTPPPPSPGPGLEPGGPASPDQPVPPAPGEPAPADLPSPSDLPAPAETPREGEAPRLPETVTVRQNDTAWGIAEQLWGDGLRWTELWEANQGRTQPDGRCWEDPELIHPGWELVVPGAEQVPAPTAESEPEPGTATADEEPAPSTEPVTHTVVPGDTLWDIAGEHLGDPTAYPEIFERNQGPQPDGRTFNDPDLIHPGWVLEVADAAVAGEAGGDDGVAKPPDQRSGETGEGDGDAGDYEVEPTVAVSVSIDSLRPGEGDGDSGDEAQSATPYSSGGHVYLVGDGVVRYVDSATFTQINAIALPGRIEATIDADGMLWTVTPRDGRLRQIVDGEIVAETQLVDPGHDVVMTLAGNRPVVLDVTADELWFVDRRTGSAADGPFAAPAGAELQAASTEGGRVWMVVGQSVIGVRPDGDAVEITLDGTPEGPPVVSEDQVELTLDDGTELTFDDATGDLLTERAPD